MQTFDGTRIDRDRHRQTGTRLEREAQLTSDRDRHRMRLQSITLRRYYACLASTTEGKYRENLIRVGET